MSQASTNPTPIDKNLFTDPKQDYIEGKALELLKNLMGNLEPNSRIAFEICRTFESGLKVNDVRSSSFMSSPLVDIHKQFPKEKVAFDKKGARRRKVLEAQKIELEEKTELSGKNLKLETEDSKRKIKDDIEVLAQVREEIKSIGLRIDYKPVYNPEDTHDLIARESDWKTLKSKIASKSRASLKSGDPQVVKNLKKLTKHLEINPLETDVVEFLLCYGKVIWFREMVDSLTDGKMKGFKHILAKTLDADIKAIEKSIAPDSTLCAKGIIYTNNDLSHHEYQEEVWLSEHVRQTLFSSLDSNIKNIQDALIGEPIETDLDLDKDFGHLKDDGEDIYKVLRQALTTGERGINTVLYGIAGLGKTHYAIALAKKLGVKIYSMEKLNKEEGDITREKKIEWIKLAFSLLEGTRSLILIDEFSDLLPGSSGNQVSSGLGGGGNTPTGYASKESIQKLIEQNPVPVIYTENDKDKFHSSILSRFRTSMEFSLPPAEDQARLWKKISARFKFNLAAEKCNDLAARYSLPVRNMEQAIQNATSGVDIERTIKESARRVFDNPRAFDRKNCLPGFYDVHLTNSRVLDRDITGGELAEKLYTHAKGKGLSLCLYGPSGSGKSAYAVNLANRLGKKTMHIPAGLLLTEPYVKAKSELEKAVYGLDNDTILVIEEDDIAEGLTPKKGEDWIKLVNQMLENKVSNLLPEIDTPIIYITNKASGDVHYSNRNHFNYTIAFDHLDQNRTQTAFTKIFKRTPPKALQKVSNTTIGDMVAVRKKLEVEIESVTAPGIVDMIKREIKSRQHKKKDLGFKDPTPKP